MHRTSAAVLLVLLALALLAAPLAAAAAPPRVTAVEVRNGGRDYRGLSLTFATPVDPAEIKRFLRFDPGVGRFSVIPGVTPAEVVVRGSFRAGRPYRLFLVPPEAPAGARPLSEHAFAGPGPESVFLFASGRRTVERRSREILPFKVNNVQRIEATLYEQPALLAVDPARVADGSTAPVDLFRRARSFAAALSGLRPAPEFAPFAPFLDDGFLAGTTECRETFFIPPDAASDRDAAFHFGVPLSFRAAPGRGGLYLGAFTGQTPAGPRTLSALVQVTDLAITYKRAPASLLLWATTLHEARPAAGAAFLLVARDDARLAAGCANEKGLLILEEGCELPALVRDGESFRIERRRLALAEIVAAVAATPEDAAFQPLSGGRFLHARYPAREGTAEVDALNVGLFTERGIYRPGEPVLFKACARAWNDGAIAPPAGSEFDLEGADPDGKEIFAETFAANEFGGFAGTVETRAHFRLGEYALRVREHRADGATGEAKILAATTFRVEEFERPRHYVSVAFREYAVEGAGYVGVAGGERRLEAVVRPLYYAGGPLKHAKVRWTAKLVPAVRRIPAFPDYAFGDGGDEEFLLESGECYTDDAGEASFSVPLERNQFNGLFAVRVAATAVDIDGRAATGAETYQPAPEFAVGVAAHPASFGTGDSYTFSAVVLAGGTTPVETGKLRVLVQRTDWFYALKRRDDGEVTYSWDEYWVDQQESECPIERGVARFTLTMGGSGSWRVRFVYGEGDAECAARSRFTVDWSGDSYEDETGVTRQDVMKASHLVLYASKRAPAVGETVAMELHARRPLTWCLVTVERDGILSADAHAVNGRDYEFPIAVEARHRPNVFVSACAIAPRHRFPVHAFQVDSEAPHAFFGVERLEVRDEAGGLAIEIEPGKADLTAAPGEEMTVALAAHAPGGGPAEAEVAVAVVDEAVLALTRFRTPSFADLARFTMPLSVVTGEGRFDLVSQDAYRLALTEALTGGDGGGAYEAIPLRKDFRPVAYFNPALRTAPDGTVSFKFKLPDSTTTYRVYAVACDRGALFGSAERKLLVTKEFRLDPMLPRFLVRGDAFTFPLALFSRAREAAAASFEVAGDPAVTLAPETTEATVPPGGRAEVAVRGEALAIAGSAKIVARGRMGEAVDGVELPRRIHSPWMRARIYVAGDLAEGGAADLPGLAELSKIPAEVLAADPPAAKLTLSRSLWSRIAPGLGYLLQYPYGCVEQTSSAMIPLAGLRGLAGRGLIASPTLAEIDLRLQAGVDRLLRMRADGGGFAYWAGQPDPDYHGTLYALLALTLAREAGFAVPAEVFPPACKYVREKAAGERLQRYHPYGIDGLAALCLAMNGELKADEVDAFAGDPKGLDAPGRAIHLLASVRANRAALARHKRTLMEANPVRELARVEPRLRFRAAAFWLMAAGALDAPAVADKLAGSLVAGLGREGYWRSTADTGICLLALADWLDRRPPDDGAPVAVKLPQAAGGGEATLADGREVVVPLDVAALRRDGSLRIELSRHALVHYTLELDYPEVYDGSVPLDRGISYTRSIEPANGSGPVRLGDIVKVSLLVTLPRDAKDGWRDYEYLAIEDPLPAGLEPINSALPAEEEPREDEARDDGWYWRDGFYDFVPDHQEFRDDRVVVFRDRCWSGSFRYEYFARAVCVGRFKHRPGRAHLMYEPDVFGVAPGGDFTVEPAR